MGVGFVLILAGSILATRLVQPTPPPELAPAVPAD
jgi:hypothetical protein